MEIDLDRLAADVRRSLDSYEIPDSHPADALGVPLSRGWYQQSLADMRAALISPYWMKMRDLDPRTGSLVVLSVAVVADDNEGSMVAYDPADEGEFVLLVHDPDPDAARGINAVSSGVRRDAVGCFLSR